MQVDIIDENVTYTVVVHVDEETRRIIHWNLGNPDGEMANRDAIGRWIQQTLLTAFNNVRRVQQEGAC